MKEMDSSRTKPGPFQNFSACLVEKERNEVEWKRVRLSSPDEIAVKENSKATHLAFQEKDWQTDIQINFLSGLNPFNRSTDEEEN